MNQPYRRYYPASQKADRFGFPPSDHQIIKNVRKLQKALTLCQEFWTPLEPKKRASEPAPLVYPV